MSASKGDPSALQTPWPAAAGAPSADIVAEGEAAVGFAPEGEGVGRAQLGARIAASASEHVHVRTHLVRLLAARPLDAKSEPEAVMRHDARFVPRLSRARQAAHTTIAPAASAHVVTGGTDGLGLLTARWLAQRGDARTLALASRSGVLAPGADKARCRQTYLANLRLAAARMAEAGGILAVIEPINNHPAPVGIEGYFLNYQQEDETGQNIGLHKKEMLWQL